MTQELWQLDATDLATRIQRREVTARQAVDAHLARLDAVNPKINAVVHFCHDEARASADAADAMLAAGNSMGPLHGVPITIKLTADMKGYPSDNGIAPFKDVIATEDSPVVARLRAAGGIPVGRTNSPALAMRFVTDNVLHGKTHNPWNKEVTVGGSSGGAGAAAAAGIGTIAHGSDIGGSIRWPAFCNGVAGLRPTPGRMPMYNKSGAMHRPMAAQMMAVNGPMARSVRDVRLAYEIMSGAHPGDPLSVDMPLYGQPLDGPIRVALMPQPDTGPEVHAATAACVRRAGEHLRAAGYVVDEIAPEDVPLIYRDGAQWWNRVGMVEIRQLVEPMLPAIGDEGLTRSLGFWWDLLGRVSFDEYPAALRERDTLIRNWLFFMEKYPIVVIPVFGAPSAPAWSDDRDREGMEFLLREGRFLLGHSVLGLPTTTVPVGMHQGQPQGVQIFSRRFREDLTLDAAEAVQAGEGGPLSAIDPKF